MGRRAATPSLSVSWPPNMPRLHLCSRGCPFTDGSQMLQRRDQAFFHWSSLIEA
jgi:hypothetical protein